PDGEMLQNRLTILNTSQPVIW
ncbi:2-amino-4-hydroxy-6-hydroxymethyldihydropteridine diphosphokinase, partial [Escherichia coli]|nr:2-amino-4-hydroxy-6-hydroxymethyldihydropteridine diphosphokinase [Escherichia coli]